MLVSEREKGGIERGERGCRQAMTQTLSLEFHRVGTMNRRFGDDEIPKRANRQDSALKTRRVGKKGRGEGRWGN